METITPLSSIFPVGSATSQGRGHGQNQQPLYRGQLFMALVLENLGNDRYILNIGGNRITAKSEAALSPGQRLRLEVIKTGPDILLKIVADTPFNPFSGRSLALLGKSLDISALFQALRQQNPLLLQSLSPPSRYILESFSALQQSDLAAKDGGTVLQQLIQNTGLDLERLLATGEKNGAMHTVKAALLEIANSITSADSIGETANRILATLELFQLVQAQAGSETQFLLPLPLPQLDRAYLIVEKDPGGSSSDSGSSDSRFSLHLAVNGLGNLRIEFLQNGEGLYIRFSAENKYISDFIATYSDELRNYISSKNLLGLSFTGDAPDPINELVRRLTTESGTMLDTKA